jgi:hypothetical protein
VKKTTDQTIKAMGKYTTETTLKTHLAIVDINLTLTRRLKLKKERLIYRETLRPLRITNESQADPESLKRLIKSATKSSIKSDKLDEFTVEYEIVKIHGISN